MLTTYYTVLCYDLPTAGGATAPPAATPAAPPPPAYGGKYINDEAGGRVGYGTAGVFWVCLE